jgi:hypothetical protein
MSVPTCPSSSHMHRRTKGECRSRLIGLPAHAASRAHPRHPMRTEEKGQAGGHPPSPSSGGDTRHPRPAGGTPAIPVQRGGHPPSPSRGLQGLARPLRPVRTAPQPVPQHALPLLQHRHPHDARLRRRDPVQQRRVRRGPRPRPHVLRPRRLRRRPPPRAQRETAIRDSVARLVDLCRLTRAPAALEERVRSAGGLVCLPWCGRRQATRTIRGAGGLRVTGGLPGLPATRTTGGAPHAFAHVAQLPRAMQARVLAGVAGPLLPRLRGLGDDYRAHLAQVLRPCAFRDGEVVFRAGDAAADMYWVVSGRVALLRDSDAGGGGSPARGKGCLGRSLEGIGCSPSRAVPDARAAAARPSPPSRKGTRPPLARTDRARTAAERTA